jgi:hypothetical protein
MKWSNFFPMILTGWVAMFTSIATQAQSIFINQVQEYSSIDSCAVVPLSTIVRDMVSGCYDGGMTTSYNCFCSTSSDRFNNIIATAVSSNCSGTISDVVSALEVFQAYCGLGAKRTSSSTSICESYYILWLSVVAQHHPY